MRPFLRSVPHGGGGVCVCGRSAIHFWGPAAAGEGGVKLAGRNAIYFCHHLQPRWIGRTWADGADGQITRWRGTRAGSARLSRRCAAEGQTQSIWR